MARTFEGLLAALHEEGLTWLTVDDVIDNLGAVARWHQQSSRPVERWYHDPESGQASGPHIEERSMGDARLDLQDLCVRAGWPLPLDGGGRDHTTPAALAVQEAKRLLAEAMVADSTEQGASANMIADRARNAQSRPTTLKLLSTEVLRHDTVQALGALMDADVPLFVDGTLAREVTVVAAWDDEPQAVRRQHLTEAQRALEGARLELCDESGQRLDITVLAADGAPSATVRRIA
ncbi:hypothetical protein ACIO3O_40060 [Streptomyces sp. NPDC087440]|uniref:hypothetical protein n=1 Tax=Streptomyces sp. NPDC087440 TaxID=3365790 RepID=UPI00381DA664